MKKLLIPSIAAVDKGEAIYRGDEDRFNPMKIIFGINYLRHCVTMKRSILPWLHRVRIWA